MSNNERVGTLKEEKRFVASGKSLWDFVVSGNAVILSDTMALSVNECEGRIVICHSPSPDVILYMRHAAAVVAETGGPLCHAAVLAMEIGCPIIVAANSITSLINNGSKLILISEDGVGKIYETVV